MPLKYRRNYTKTGYAMNYMQADRRLLGMLSNALFQFRIELQGITPPIWRRIQVPSEYNFWDLHVALQDAFGWEDSHLHFFEIKSMGKRKPYRIGIPDLDGFDLDPEHEIYPGWEIPIATYFNFLGMEGVYRYDFGDDWAHTIRLEGYLAREKGTQFPHCLDGARACPPEDCGGEPGYHQLLEILAKPKHPQHKEMREWVGPAWDPERFDKGALKFDDPHKRWRRAFLEEMPSGQKGWVRS